MSAKQRGSKLDQLYSDGGGSKLDQLYSDGGNSNPEMKAAEMRRKTQNGAYKNALRDTRSKDPNERASGYKRALDMQNQGYQPQVGIPGDGEYDAQDRKYADNHVREGLVLEAQAKKRQEAEFGGKPSPASPQVPSPGGAVTPAGGAENPFINGSGYKSGSEVAAAAPAPHVGQGATSPAATPSAPPRAPVNSKPVATDWRTQRATALEALKGKFSKQDEANALAAKVPPQGVDPKYRAATEQMAEELTGSDKLMPIRTPNASEIVAKDAAKAAQKPAEKPVSTLTSQEESVFDNFTSTLSKVDEKFKSMESKREERNQYRQVEMEIAESQRKSGGARVFNAEYGAPRAYQNMETGVTSSKVRRWEDEQPRKKEAPVDISGKQNNQASNQIKQQKDNFYNGQINSVLEHSSFLQRYAV